MTTHDNPEQPQTVDEARDAVERSRERISRTLDRLETRIVEKKHELQDRADVFRPVKRQVRMRPLTAVALGFGIGVVLGSVGGGDDRRKQSRRSHANGRHDRTERLARRDWREQRRERLRAHADLAHADGRSHERSARFDSVRGQLMGAITSALTAAITSAVKDYVRDRSHSRADARA